MAYTFFSLTSRDKKNTFWIKCVCVLIIAMLLPLSILFVYNTQQYNNSLEEALLQNNISALTNMTDAVDELHSSMIGIRDTLLLNDALSESYSPLYYKSANNLQKLLLSYAFVNPSITEIFLHSGSDQHIFSSRSSYTAKTIQRKFLLSDDNVTSIMNNQFTSTQVLRAYDHYYSSDCLIYCFCFKSPNNIDRTLLVEIPTKIIETIISRSNIPENSHIFLMNNNGQVSFNYSSSDKNIDFLPLILQFSNRKNIQNQPVEISSSYYYMSLLKSKWFDEYLVLFAPLESALSPAISQKNMSILLLIITMLISCIFIFPILHLIRAPISTLKKHVLEEATPNPDSGYKGSLLPETESIISYIDNIKLKNEELRLHITSLQHDYDQILLTQFLLNGIHQLEDFSNLPGFDQLNGQEISFFIYILQSFKRIELENVCQAMGTPFHIPGKCIHIMMPDQDTNRFIGLVLLSAKHEEELIINARKMLPDIQNQLNTPIIVGIGGCYQNFASSQQSLMEAYCAIDQAKYEDGQSIMCDFSLQIDNESVDYLFSILTSRDSIQSMSISDIDKLLSKLAEYISLLDNDISQAKYIAYKALTFVNDYVSTVTGEAPIILYSHISKLASYYQLSEIKTFMLNTTTAMLKKVHLNPTDQRFLLYSEMQHYIEDHISDPMFSVADMADHFKMSVAILSKYFKDKSGTGVMDYMAHKRIEKACSLLSDTTMSVKDISIAIGYYNDSSFIRRFSSIMGVSPGQYRKAPTKYKIPENN